MASRMLLCQLAALVKELVAISVASSGSGTFCMPSHTMAQRPAKTLRLPQGSERPGETPEGERTPHYAHRHCGVRSDIDEQRFEILQRSGWPLALHCAWCGIEVAISQVRFLRDYELE